MYISLNSPKCSDIIIWAEEHVVVSVIAVSNYENISTCKRVIKHYHAEKLRN